MFGYATVARKPSLKEIRAAVAAKKTDTRKKLLRSLPQNGSQITILNCAPPHYMLQINLPSAVNLCSSLRVLNG